MVGRHAVIAVTALVGGLVLGAPVFANDTNAASKSVGGQSFDIPDPSQSGHVGEVYMNICAGCHDQGVDRAPQRVLFSYMSPQSIYRALKDGKMAEQASSLSDEDKVA